MQAQARALGNALAIALISILLMLGALSISLVGFTPEATPTITNMAPFATLPAATNFPQPTITSMGLISAVASTETLSPTPTITVPLFVTCDIPTGWVQVFVLQNDTLETVAARYNTSADQLSSGNCLLTRTLIAGTTINVPPLPQASAACVPGASGWNKNYMVRAGDTFYALSVRYATSTAIMKDVNCRASDEIYVGEFLWVPFVAATLPPPPSLTPLPGDTAIPYPTAPLTETPMILPFTITPVPSPIPDTPTAIPTLTASPTAYPQ